ncbi:MAG: class I SAM-dependent RNA methyltransferase [Dehalococcoidia bacterium]|nr:class I SAM-dependent RNA methyltransferase [Dehalococcoidia bacterium]MCB9486823.1 class I SAM-dependent RNA methyltransferase [Thermoflexaceae bacterium]
MPRRRKLFTPETPPYAGDVITLTAGPIVFGGASLCRLDDGRIVFLSFAIPGERVEAVVERVHADYLEAAVQSVSDPSPDRVEPRCGLFGECGGCQLQHMAYPAQLAAKEEVVREQLRRIGGLDESAVRPVAGAANPWGYRNHLRFSCGKKYGDVGFIHRNRRSLLTVESCPIADPWVSDLLPALQGKGVGLHQIQVRHSQETGSYLFWPALEDVGVPTGQKSYVEELGGRRFDVSSAAFFQVNHAQAEQMLRLIGEALPERGALLVDAFAGVGTFAVLFADRFERVVAIEESVAAARNSAANLLSTPNVEMRVGRVEDVLPFLERSPDAVVLDPPRPGCHPEVLDSIARFRAGTVVYVSCNPATLARDLRILVDRGYRLDRVTPIDMFPQTGHIECVARLELEDPSE